MKKLMMTMLLSAFCWTAFASNLPWQDTTKKRQDTTKKHVKKASPVHKKTKKDWSKKRDTMNKKDRKPDSTLKPPVNY